MRIHLGGANKKKLMIRYRCVCFWGRTDLGTRSNMYKYVFSKYKFLLPRNPNLIIRLYAHDNLKFKLKIKELFFLLYGWIHSWYSFPPTEDFCLLANFKSNTDLRSFWKSDHFERFFASISKGTTLFVMKIVHNHYL